MNINEVIIEAEYVDILLTLINPPYEISSITKLVIMSFCIKHETNTSVYNNRVRDFIDEFFDNISLKLSANYNEFTHIVRVIDMLNSSSKVIVDGDYIEPNHRQIFKPENTFLKYCSTKSPNPIMEINKLDAKALLEEVIRYV